MEFKNIEQFNPRECISGKIMRINRITANIFRKHLAPFKVTDSQLTLLFVLTKAGGLTQKQLSDFVYLEKSSLNRNLKRLVDKEYLSRNNFPIIEITHQGKIFVEEIIPEWEKAMTEIRAVIGEDGEQSISKVLTLLSNNTRLIK
ncbi:MAG: MarR family transcriptional regulator [Flavobacteriaceae bacterium]|nr:MarR family transcriptional regulator [Flavobacteriaceae bacterium]